MLQSARARLSTLDDANITATALLGHVLGLTRAQVLARPETVLTPEQASALEALVARAALGEPLAYLTGRREFYGLEFEVDERVLVPRPETELLVDRALAARPARVLDVGTGSGCIAVALAVNLPQATITASDVSAGALEVARRNAQRHRVADRIEFVQSDLLDFWISPTSHTCPHPPMGVPLLTPAPTPAPTTRCGVLPLGSHFPHLPPASHGGPASSFQPPFQLIAANLPYIDPDELRTLPVSRCEPRLALDGGPGGLALIKRLLSQAPGALAPGGLVLLEIGAGQGPAALRLAQAAFPDASTRIERDLAGLDRFLVIETP